MGDAARLFMRGLGTIVRYLLFLACAFLAMYAVLGSNVIP